MGKVMVVGDEGMQGKEADPRMMARWKDGVRARQSKRPVLSPQVRRMVIDGCGGDAKQRLQLQAVGPRLNFERSSRAEVIRLGRQERISQQHPKAVSDARN